MSISKEQQAKLDKLAAMLAALSRSVVEENPDVDDADALLGKIAESIKPPCPSPIDTRSKEAFGADMTQKAVAAFHLNLIGIGDELGFFVTLLEKPMSHDDLAKAVGCDARYLKEWCTVMTAGKVLEYDASQNTFSVTPAFPSPSLPFLHSSSP